MLERNLEVGGLARTVQRNGYRFDYGGYRFIAASSEVVRLLREILGPDLLSVSATSKIYYRNKLYAYPVDPRDLVQKLSRREATIALWSYAGSRLARYLPTHHSPRNLEEWLLDEFGETLYRAFFRDYNEKIWGIPCHRLSAELASRRIRGLKPLTELARGALPKRWTRWKKAHRFLYPRHGIGQLSEAFAETIERRGSIIRGATVTEMHVRRARVETVVYRDASGKLHEQKGTNVVSSVPLPRLLYLLKPSPPGDVLASARALKFRDLVAVCLELRRDRVTEDSWLYVPDAHVGFARLLEPKGWSEAMAPPGRTSLVAEYYCFEGDAIWTMDEKTLVERTVADLAHRLCLIDQSEVLGGFVLRIRKPYPVYELGYHEHLHRIHQYLKSIVNLQAIGRGGLFKYYNVGHLLRSGIRAAENVFGAGHDLWGIEADNLPAAGFFRL